MPSNRLPVVVAVVLVAAASLLCSAPDPPSVDFACLSSPCVHGVCVDQFNRQAQKIYFHRPSSVHGIRFTGGGIKITRGFCLPFAVKTALFNSSSVPSNDAHILLLNSEFSLSIPIINKMRQD